MADMRLLERTLHENVAWNRARINFLARFIIALIEVRTVNLSEVANVFAGRAKPASHYKRAQRFLRFFELPYAQVARFVVRLLGVSAPWVITMDRTDWCLGETPLNIMVIGIAYRGVAFPVLWTILEKKGCSATSERIALVREFIRVFGYHSVSYLCADREFVGRDWFSWLRAQRIDFRIRVRENTKVENGRGELVSAWRLFRSQRINEALVIERARSLWGLPLFVSGARLASGEYVIVVAPGFTAQALSDYARRWEIETLFSCLKSRGFRLEETHVTDPDRLKKLVALLALSFCWAHIIGEWLARRQPLKIKKHGRPAVSIFRHGFDHLRRILCNLTSIAQQVAFRQVTKLLSCT
jgi:Transposase DDE domain